LNLFFHNEKRSELRGESLRLRDRMAVAPALGPTGCSGVRLSR
jgi:hypothetical protein